MTMAMSTQTLLEASRLLETMLVDRLTIHDVGEPVTVGAQVTRALSDPLATVDGLVQTISLENAVEGRVTQLYSIKIGRSHTQVRAGQAIKVLTCAQEPSLVGRVLLIDTISQSGLSTIRKGTAQVARTVNQEGKEVLA